MSSFLCACVYIIACTCLCSNILYYFLNIQNPEGTTNFLWIPRIRSPVVACAFFLPLSLCPSAQISQHPDQLRQISKGFRCLTQCLLLWSLSAQKSFALSNFLSHLLLASNISESFFTFSNVQNSDSSSSRMLWPLSISNSTRNSACRLCSAPGYISAPGYFSFFLLIYLKSLLSLLLGYSKDRRYI